MKVSKGDKVTFRKGEGAYVYDVLDVKHGVTLTVRQTGGNYAPQMVDVSMVARVVRRGSAK